MAALELRIEKLDRRLVYARSRKDSVALHDPDATQSVGGEGERKDSLATIRAAIHRKAARTMENSDINSLVSDFGFLYVPLDAQPWHVRLLTTILQGRLMQPPETSNPPSPT